jgi:hypothetical protein
MSVFRLRAALEPGVPLREAQRSTTFVQNRMSMGAGMLVSPIALLVLALWLTYDFVAFTPVFFRSLTTADAIFSSGVTIALLALGAFLLWRRVLRQFGILTGSRRKAEAYAGPVGVCWGDQAVRASRLGVAVRRARERDVFRWRAFVSLEEKRGYVRLGVTDDWAVTIPDAAFADTAQRREFLAFARRMMSAA